MSFFEDLLHVHPDAVVAWDRDVGIQVDETPRIYLGGGLSPSVFIGVHDDRETWYAWENETWCKHQALKTITQIREEKEEKKEDDPFFPWLDTYP